MIGTSNEVESACGWHGKVGALTPVLLSLGWIDSTPDGYRIHDLYDHAPEYVRRRMTREDVRRSHGVTLRELREEAGKKGAEARWKHFDEDGKRMASDVRLPKKEAAYKNGKWMASDSQPTTTTTTTTTPRPLNSIVSQSQTEPEDAPTPEEVHAIISDITSRLSSTPEQTTEHAERVRLQAAAFKAGRMP